MLGHLLCLPLSWWSRGHQNPPAAPESCRGPGEAGLEDCVHRKLSHPDSLVRTWAGCQIFSHPPPRAPPSFPWLPQIWGFLSSLPFPLSVTCVPGFPPDQRNGDKEFVIRRAATNRVLNVLRHWVSKHSQVGGTPRDAPQSRRAAGDPRSLTQELAALIFLGGPAQIPYKGT